MRRLNHNATRKRIPFLAYALGEVLLLVTGILIALQINNWNEGRKNCVKEQVALGAILSDIDLIESYLESRHQVFESDSVWFDHLSKNWDDLNVDSVALEFSQNGFKASVHNLFLDFREFHPPMASLVSVTEDGTYNLLREEKIKKEISALVFMNLEEVLLNVQVEIDLSVMFRDKLIADPDPQVVRLLDSTQDDLMQRFNGSEDHHAQTVTELEVLLSKPYARNYLNLKARQRIFTLSFIRRFEAKLALLKSAITEELEKNSQ
jgi:hypothetical protein